MLPIAAYHGHAIGVATSLDLAFALHRAKGIEVMGANPRLIADFGRALIQRSKTDELDDLSG
jgi:transposase